MSAPESRSTDIVDPDFVEAEDVQTEFERGVAEGIRRREELANEVLQQVGWWEEQYQLQAARIEELEAGGAAQRPVTRGGTTWTPAEYWEYVEGFTGEWERDQMRDTLAERGLQIVGIGDLAYTAQEPWQNLDLIIDALEKAECCRNGHVYAAEDVIAHAIRDWLRASVVPSTQCAAPIGDRSVGDALADHISKSAK